MEFTYSRSVSPSFTGKGLVGYAFGPLKQKNLAIDYVEVEKGHDTFQVSNRIYRTYYILSGTGYFTINSRRYPVSPGTLVEVPPKIEYSYSGEMTLIVFQSGRWFHYNDRSTKWNPDVVKGDFPTAPDSGFSLIRLAKLRIFGKSPINAFLRLNQVFWKNVPDAFTDFAAVRSYGNFLNTLARIVGVRAIRYKYIIAGVRGQAFATYFLRNRPQLQLIGRLAAQRGEANPLRIAVLGCSTGAEVYSIAWAIRSAQPQLQLTLYAVDISRDAVEIGKRGVYSILGSQWTNSDIFERMTGGEIEEFFEEINDIRSVRSWIKEGIKWQVGDVGDPDLLDVLGQQDIVVANNFLCHMDPPIAEGCLRNIARLVKPEGFLVVSGIDLDIRTRVADDLGWLPVEELLEEIHEGDPYMTNLWPFHYAALEPLNKSRQDWRHRYAAVFQLLPNGEAGSGLEQLSLLLEKDTDDTVTRAVSAATLDASVSTDASHSR